MKTKAVIPSHATSCAPKPLRRRCDGKEPRNCKLRHHLMGGAHRRCEVPRFARNDALLRASLTFLPRI
jgi:hypothetical protein